MSDCQDISGTELDFRFIPTTSNPQIGLCIGVSGTQQLLPAIQNTGSISFTVSLYSPYITVYDSSLVQPVLTIGDGVAVSNYCSSITPKAGQVGVTSYFYLTIFQRYISQDLKQEDIILDSTPARATNEMVFDLYEIAYGDHPFSLDGYVGITSPPVALNTFPQLTNNLDLIYQSQGRTTIDDYLTFDLSALVIKDFNACWQPPRLTNKVVISGASDVRGSYSPPDIALVSISLDQEPYVLINQTTGIKLDTPWYPPDISATVLPGCVPDIENNLISGFVGQSTSILDLETTPNIVTDLNICSLDKNPETLEELPFHIFPFYANARYECGQFGVDFYDGISAVGTFYASFDLPIATGYTGEIAQVALQATYGLTPVEFGQGIVQTTSLTAVAPVEISATGSIGITQIQNTIAAEWWLVPNLLHTGITTISGVSYSGSDYTMYAGGNNSIYSISGNCVTMKSSTSVPAGSNAIVVDNDGILNTDDIRISFKRTAASSWFDDDFTDSALAIILSPNRTIAERTYDSSSWGYYRPNYQANDLGINFRAKSNLSGAIRITYYGASNYSLTVSTPFTANEMNGVDDLIIKIETSSSSATITVLAKDGTTVRQSGTFPHLANWNDNSRTTTTNLITVHHHNYKSAYNYSEVFCDLNLGVPFNLTTYEAFTLGSGTAWAGEFGAVDVSALPQFSSSLLTGETLASLDLTTVAAPFAGFLSTVYVGELGAVEILTDPRILNVNIYTGESSSSSLSIYPQITFDSTGFVGEILSPTPLYTASSLDLAGYIGEELLSVSLKTLPSCLIIDDFSAATLDTNAWTTYVSNSSRANVSISSGRAACAITSSYATAAIISKEYVRSINGKDVIQFQWTPGKHYSSAYAVPYFALIPTSTSFSREATYGYPLNVFCVFLGKNTDTTTRTEIRMGMSAAGGLVASGGTTITGLSFSQGTVYDVRLEINWGGISQLSINGVYRGEVTTPVSFAENEYRVELANSGYYTSGCTEYFDNVRFCINLGESDELAAQQYVGEFLGATLASSAVFDSNGYTGEFSGVDLTLNPQDLLVPSGYVGEESRGSLSTIQSLDAGTTLGVTLASVNLVENLPDLISALIPIGDTLVVDNLRTNVVLIPNSMECGQTQSTLTLTTYVNTGMPAVGYTGEIFSQVTLWVDVSVAPNIVPAGEILTFDLTYVVNTGMPTVGYVGGTLELSLLNITWDAFRGAVIQVGEFSQAHLSITDSSYQASAQTGITQTTTLTTKGPPELDGTVYCGFTSTQSLSMEFSTIISRQWFGVTGSCSLEDSPGEAIVVSNYTGITGQVAVLNTTVHLGTIQPRDGSTLALTTIASTENYKFYCGETASISTIAVEYGFSSLNAYVGEQTSRPIFSTGPSQSIIASGSSTKAYTGIEGIALLSTLHTVYLSSDIVLCTRMECDLGGTTNFELQNDSCCGPRIANACGYWFEMEFAPTIDENYHSRDHLVFSVDLYTKTNFPTSFVFGTKFEINDRTEALLPEYSPDGLPVQLGQRMHVSLDGELRVKLCRGALIPFGDQVNVEMNDVLPDDCQANRAYFGEILNLCSLQAYIRFNGIIWYYGQEFFSDLTIFPMKPYLGYNGIEANRPMLNVTSVFRIGNPCTYGIKMLVTFEEPHASGYNGIQAQASLTTQIMIEFLESGNLENEYRYFDEDGHETQKMITQAIELFPYLHYVKARCF